MEHTWDPGMRCMTFHLDYDRRSDLDDSVGYWYVEEKGREECRVYYSCVSKLINWVPPPVYVMLTRAALKQATIWVDRESVDVWEREKQARQFRGGPANLARNFRERARAALQQRLPMPAMESRRWTRSWPTWKAAAV